MNQETLGQYRIVEELGRGGMAVVYRAYQPALERYVAIKVLPRELSFDREFVERFLREARSAARLNHPHIVTIHDVGQAEGNHFIVMEYVDGPSLTDLLQRQGTIPPQRAAQIVSQIASALDYAHHQGFVHRDVKPANILIGAGQTAKLTDFGIVKAAEGTRLTQTGTLLGTPAYMSPEQARGIDIASSTDIYSLGVVAYEMLSGRTPFVGETMAVLHAHAYEPPNLSVLPRGVQRVVGKALEKDPRKRFRSAGAFAQALQAALSGVPARKWADTPPKRPTARATTTGATGRSRALAVWLWGVVGTSAVLVIVSLVLALSGGNRQAPAQIEPTDPVQVSRMQETSSVPEVDPSDTPTSTREEEVVVSPTSLPTPTSSPTSPPTETPTMTPLPTDTPAPTPCGVGIYSGFASLWNATRQRLGCPAQPPRTNQWIGEEAFERGKMFWRQDNDKIYVLYNAGSWQRFDDTWREGTDPEFTCGPPQSPPTPKRGFGKVWCTHAGVRSGLGNATTVEQGEHGTVQDFVGGGVIIRSTSGTYVLFPDGSWERR